MWVYWKHILTTGMILPTPKSVARKMTQNANLKGATAVVELGAGDGKITRHILSEMGPQARLFAFEINKELIQILSRIDDSRLVIIDQGAETLKDSLQKHSVTEVDYVFSSIPMSFFSKKMVGDILRSCRELITDQGAFIQYQYNLQAYKLLRQIFAQVKLQFVLFSVPPVFVFFCPKSPK